MVPPPVQDADREQARLAALRRYAILDTEPEREFDEIVQRAARECGYPTALLTLMDADRCWFKATTGVDPAHAHVRELPREQTFCNHAFRSSGIFVVPDARLDPRFARLAAVDRAGGYRAYAGVQLITPDGFSIGTLCVLDDVPHEPTDEQRATLRAQAVHAMALLESRLCRDDAPAPPMVVAAPAAAPRRAVLVVDDDELVRQFVVHLLLRHQLTVLEAADGADALERYREAADQIGLVVTDIHMPVMDGFALIRALQAEPNTPAIAVMSGRLDGVMRRDLAALGVTEVLGKPFQLSAFDKIVALLPA